MRTYDIYLITNAINNKKYVGQTRHGRAQVRFKEHCLAVKYTRRTQLLHAAINKYGKDNFILSIIETNIPETEIDQKEKYYIQYYNTFYKNKVGYNMTLGGQGIHGYVHTEADKQKASIRSKHFWQNLKQNPDAYADLCLKRSLLLKGKPKSEETKKKLSAARLGKSPINKGIPMSEAQRQKCIKAQRQNAENLIAYEYDSGKIFSKYDSAAQAIELLQLPKSATSRILLTCHDKKGHAYGYIWRFEKDYKNIDKLSDAELFLEHKIPRSKVILQLDLNDNIIAEYSSAAAYSKTITDDYSEQRKIAKAISSVCLGQKKSYNNHK